jgi:hypothetical protein
MDEPSKKNGTPDLFKSKNDHVDKKDAITKAFDSLARAASCKNVC